MKFIVFHVLFFSIGFCSSIYSQDTFYLKILKLSYVLNFIAAPFLYDDDDENILIWSCQLQHLLVSSLERFWYYLKHVSAIDFTYEDGAKKLIYM